MLARGQAAPLRFLVAVLIVWTIARGLAIEGWDPFAPHRARRGPPPGWLEQAWRGTASALPAPLARIERATARETGRLIARAVAATARRASIAATPGGPIREGAAMDPDALRLIAVDAYRPYGERGYARATGAGHAAEIAGGAAAAASPARWSGSAWAFLRGGGRARSLSSDGQIGGGQAGARLLYRLDRAGALAASARVSHTIGGARQAEAAVGIDWRPAKAVPVHLTIERRVAIDRGGRDAFAIGAAGGVYDIRPADGWRLDGYAEAGVVGARRRDLYADGAGRGGREFALGGGGGGATLTLGAGLFGAAQPDAARLDAGPSAVVRVPVEGRTVAVALDYRARLAGDAKPGSGVALTVGVDF